MTHRIANESNRIERAHRSRGDDEDAPFFNTLRSGVGVLASSSLVMARNGVVASRACIYVETKRGKSARVVRQSIVRRVDRCARASRVDDGMVGHGRFPSRRASSTSSRRRARERESAPTRAKGTHADAIVSSRTYLSAMRRASRCANDARGTRRRRRFV